MNNINNNLVLVVLKQMSNPSLTSNLTEINRFVYEMKTTNSSFAYVSAAKMLYEAVEKRSSKETADFLFERMYQYDLIKHPIANHDIGTVEGFMRAVDEVMEMFSGASMGGPMSGSGSNSLINSTGMAGSDHILRKNKKSSKIKNIINKRL